MKKRLFFVTTFIAIGCTTSLAQEPAKITYDDHIKPILREHCTSCHNANDKKSGLALDSYQALMAGGSGGEVVVEGDLDSSRLYALTAHKEQPYMPPNQDMIAQAKVDLLKTWIEQGMPENSGSEIKKPKASAMALSVKIGRPEGAPPMPTNRTETDSIRHPACCDDIGNCCQSMVASGRGRWTNASFAISQ